MPHLAQHAPNLTLAPFSQHQPDSVMGRGGLEGPGQPISQHHPLGKLTTSLFTDSAPLAPGPVQFGYLVTGVGEKLGQVSIVG